jgi:sRNA-binding protein
MLETPIAQPSPAPSGKEKSPYQADRLRGVKEARTAIEALKVKWPAIFNDPKTIKPLASSFLSQVAAALGWTLGYTRGVFHVWKSREDYCRAVLRDSVRVHLDGSPSEEVVDDRAREMAKAQLDKNGARNAAKRARELAEANAKDAQGNPNGDAAPPEPHDGLPRKVG